MVEKSEIFATIGGKQSNNIFEGDDGGFDGHLVEDTQPFPEEATAGGGEAAHLAGEGEVLAGEASPDDIALGNGAAVDVFDGAEVEMIVAVVGGVDGGLLRADVVRPDGGAGVPCPLGDKAAAGKKIDKGWKVCFQRFHQTVC